MSLVFPSFGQEAKPRVAVKEPVVGEGVKKSVRRFLNISTIHAEMEAALVAVRKFDLVTRKKSRLDALREEQKLAKSDLFKGNAAPEGQLENAHYILVPEVRDFKFLRTVKPVPNISSKYRRRDSGLLEISAQVLDTKTGGIKGTFSLKSTFATRWEVVNTRRGSPNSLHFTKMAKKVSAQMADQLLDTVFPMLVIQISGIRVYINRGTDGGLKAGKLLNVYRPGAQLIDPYTKEVLGTTEELIGQVKVTRINPKFTIGEVVRKGLKQPVAVNDVLRKP